MKNIAVLGAGMIGGVIARDLAVDFNVSVYDRDRERLNNIPENKNLKCRQLDFGDQRAFSGEIGKCDLVVSAVSSTIGHSTLKNVIELGKDVVDIAFSGEDPFLLDDIAKRNNVTAVVDCGVAPGLSNIILGYFNMRMQLDSFECYVGGLPFKRILPFEYKAPFAPMDVIEEYTRPARIVENGRIVIKPAMSEPEIIEFAETGSLEAFNTDGLRTLLKTMKIPNMKEKTIRYPGHIDKIKFLHDAGFFSDKQITVNGIKVLPIELTSGILLKHWELKRGEKEYTVMRINLKGNNKTVTVNLFDQFDESTGYTSMSRTTGFTCAAAAKLIIERKYIRKGIIPPEYISQDEGCYFDIVNYLRRRGINLQIS